MRPRHAPLQQLHALFQASSRPAPHTGGAGRPAQRLGAYAFLVLALLPTMLLLALVTQHLSATLLDIKTTALNTNSTHLPGILASQRRLINIENLRRSIETMYNAFDPAVRRMAMIDAIGLATEAVFEPDSRFAEHAGSAITLIRSLNAAKQRADEAEKNCKRVQPRLLDAASSLAPRMPVAGEAGVLLPLAEYFLAPSAHSPRNADEMLRRLEPFLTFCTSLHGADGVGTVQTAACTQLHQSLTEVDLTHRAHRAADAEAQSLWKQFDDLLLTLSNLASSEEAERTYTAMEHINEGAEYAHNVFYLSVAGVVLTLCLFIVALIHYVLAPLALAARALGRIRDGHAIEPPPPVRIRELQEMLDMLPMLSGYVRELSTRSGQLEQENDKFRTLSLVDGLTGVDNRRCFDTCLAEMDSAHSLALLMIDVDMFKLYNDACGHQAGDHVLKSVAQAMRAALLRSADRVFRYGGEEFCVLLPDASETSALMVAERLRAAIQALDIPHPTSTVAGQVTVSIGAALRCACTDETHQNLIERADKALYQAKMLGRNRVHVDETAATPVASAAGDAEDMTLPSS